MSRETDTYYIEQVLKGDKSAFSYLVNRYSEMVYSISLKILKNTADAEDLAQEVFISAFQSLGSFKGNSKFSTWLYRIAYNKAISKTRKANFEISTEKEHLFEIRGGIELQVHGLSDEEERVKILQQVIRQLPDDEQLLIMLHYFEDQTMEDISEITRITVSNVKVKLFRIRKKLKDMIEQIDHEVYLLIE